MNYLFKLKIKHNSKVDTIYVTGTTLEDAENEARRRYRAVEILQVQGTCQVSKRIRAKGKTDTAVVLDQSATLE